MLQEDKVISWFVSLYLQTSQVTKCLRINWLTDQFTSCVSNWFNNLSAVGIQQFYVSANQRYLHKFTLNVYNPTFISSGWGGDGVKDEKAAKPVTTVQDCISIDIFLERPREVFQISLLCVLKKDFSDISRRLCGAGGQNADPLLRPERKQCCRNMKLKSELHDNNIFPTFYSAEFSISISSSRWLLPHHTLSFWHSSTCVVI